VLLRLAQLKILMKDTKAAANIMTRWLTRNPKDTEVRQTLAMVLMGQKDEAGARAQYGCT